MTHRGGRRVGKPTASAGAFLASLAAGPLFLLAALLAVWQEQVAKPILVSSGDLLQLPPLLLAALFFGFVLSVVPNLVGTLAMSLLGSRIPQLRSPLAWMAAGAASGAALAGVVGAFEEPALAFALIATSSVCARICRLRIEFIPEDDSRP